VAVSDALLDVTQTCEYLGGIGRSTLYRIVKDGRLKPVKMVVGTRFRTQDLDRYLLENTRTGPGVVPLPRRFTLYRFYDTAGELLYVGITTQGASRWHAHAKDQPWWTEVATIKVEHLSSLEELVPAELQAIRAKNPRYNIKGRP
jgi:excisionase family DNA binding protein